MPNLETYYQLYKTLVRVRYEDKKMMADTHGFEPNSFKLKTLGFDLKLEMPWNVLKVFDVEELATLDQCQWPIDGFVDYVKTCKNLKNFSMRNNFRKKEILDALSRMRNVEKLKLGLDVDDQKPFENFMWSQGKLKSLSLSMTWNHIIPYTDTRLLNLECLQLDAEIFSKSDSGGLQAINRINNLKSLAIIGRVWKHDVDVYEIISNFYLPNLTHLTLKTQCLITDSQIQKISENFSTLESLDIMIFYHEYTDRIEEIFTHFNQLESLSVVSSFPHESEDRRVNEGFYAENHKNLNLKSLNLEVCNFDAQKLMSKFMTDFPNLEKFPDDFFDAHHELLLYNFENFPSFVLDLSSAEDINEKLKYCSVKSKEHLKDERKNFNLVLATRDGGGVIDFDVRMVRNFKKCFCYKF
jgi:hypothetical protein